MSEDLSKLKAYPHLVQEVPSLNPRMEVRKNTRKGSHCLNYHLSGDGKSGEPVHVYVKCGKEHVFASDAKRYQEQYVELRSALGAMIPRTSFVQTLVDGRPSVIVCVEPVVIKMDMIKPAQQARLIKKLRSDPALSAQLKEFLEVTGIWEEAGKILDLSNTGTENLVLDDKNNIRYIDSFDVFLGESCHPRLKEESVRNRAMLMNSYQQSLVTGH